MAKPVPVDVKPELLRWALSRSRRTVEDLNYGETRNLQPWLDRKAKPTLNQLQEFAKRTYVPFGYLLLDNPPADSLPWPGPADPSGPLVDFAGWVDGYCSSMRVIHAYNDVEPLPFVGKYADPVMAVGEIHRTFGVEGTTWRKFATTLREHAERAHVVVLAPKRHRRAILDVSEFAGVVKADVMAPVVAINGNAAGPVQLFALCTGLVSVLTGKSGIISPGGRRRFDMGQKDVSTQVLRAVLGGMLDLRNASKSPMAWPAVSDYLAAEIFCGARSGILQYTEAWDLAGVKAFRAAEARENASRAGPKPPVARTPGRPGGLPARHHLGGVAGHRNAPSGRLRSGGPGPPQGALCGPAPPPGRPRERQQYRAARPDGRRRPRSRHRRS